MLPGLGERAKGTGTEKQREHRQESEGPGQAGLEGRRPAGGPAEEVRRQAQGQGWQGVRRWWAGPKSFALAPQGGKNATQT